MLPSVDSLISTAIDRISNKFIAQIAPHYVNEFRYIESSGDKRIKQAFEFVKRNIWDEAKDIWENILNDPRHFKVHPACYNNLGVYYETIGDLDKAEEGFTKAYKLSAKSKYLDGKARIQRRKKEQERLKKQIEQEQK